MKNRGHSVSLLPSIGEIFFSDIPGGILRPFYNFNGGFLTGIVTTDEGETLVCCSLARNRYHVDVLRNLNKFTVPDFIPIGVGRCTVQSHKK